MADQRLLRGQEEYSSKRERQECEAKRWFPNSKNWFAEIPSWAYDETVAERIKQLEQHTCEPCPLGCTTGLAAKRSLVAGFWLAVFWVCVPFAVWKVTICSERSDLDYADYDTLKVCLVAFPIFIIFLWMEFYCLRFSIIPQWQVAGGFLILGKQRSFRSFLMFNFAMSFFGHLDLLFNGAFLVKTWKTSTCTWGGKIESVWTEVMLQSGFHYIPGLVENVRPPFHVLCTGLWLLIASQIIYCLYVAVPLHKTRWWYECFGCGRLFNCCKRRNGWNDKYLADEWKPKYETCTYEEMVDFACNSGDGKGFRYQTWADEGDKSTTCHGSVLLGMSLWTRMCSILAMRTVYEQKKVEYYIVIDRPGPIFGIMKRTLATSLHRLLFVGILQSSFQLQLQISWFGMITFMTKRLMFFPTFSELSMATFFWTCMDLHMFLSILTCFLFYVKTGYEEWASLKWIREHMAKDAWDKIMSEEHKTCLKRRLAFADFCFSIYVVLGLWCVCKLLAVFLCPCSLWNVTGCAKIPDTCFKGNTP